MKALWVALGALATLAGLVGAEEMWWQREQALVRRWED